MNPLSSQSEWCCIEILPGWFSSRYHHSRCHLSKVFWMSYVFGRDSFKTSKTIKTRYVPCPSSRIRFRSLFCFHSLWIPLFLILLKSLWLLEFEFSFLTGTKILKRQSKGSRYSYLLLPFGRPHAPFTPVWQCDSSLSTFLLVCKLQGKKTNSKSRKLSDCPLCELGP